MKEGTSKRQHRPQKLEVETRDENADQVSGVLGIGMVGSRLSVRGARFSSGTFVCPGKGGKRERLEGDHPPQFPHV